MAADPPVMCTLSDAEMRDRESRLLAKFKSGVISTEELATGYAFRLPGDPQWLALLSELIIAERECCRFVKFELQADPERGPLTLRITGPGGTKEFLKTTFI